jgi:hypothetical protein
MRDVVMALTAALAVFDWSVRVIARIWWYAAPPAWFLLLIGNELESRRCRA